MISKELNFPDFRFPKIRLTALRTVFCPSKPNTVAPISPASQKKLHPASLIFRPNPYPSRFLTNLQPVAQGSLSNRSASGKNMPSLIRIVPLLIVSAIWAPILALFSRRLPQFSNDSTGRVERGPGLAFALQRFRQKGAFLDQGGSRFDSVCHLRLRCIFNGAYDCHAHSFTVTRLAGLDLLLTSY